MSEVLRRVQDLLVGDVVAHQGKARKVERVSFDPIGSLVNGGG